ncbi:hypothetical protein [Acidicapsa acidisoli]|uniref:hypothetical protein n=1 Tax=Acidicapsa acidisoli TaxID=1615681 RepID=UPI0021E0F996|nr:hypothetical protein [Acidicapsa acidisoli]
MPGEFDAMLVRLGIKAEPGADKPVDTSVLREGYSTTDLSGFTEELRRRLRRLERIHRVLADENFDSAAWEKLMRIAREVPKLTLARYVFMPDEVVREVKRQLRMGRGAEATLSQFKQTAAAHWAAEPLDAPVFETEIVKRLCADRATYWISEQCGSELNALVEYPLTSAAVAIKLPGSDLEIEIKRAGIRGDCLMSVITERNGTYAPTSHRLFGGSLGWLAQRETTAAGIFSRIFRLVHGREAPSSRTVQNNSIVGIPAADGEVHLLDYLTDESSFGADFGSMRAAMQTCIDAFPSDTGVAKASYASEAGRTLQFIGQALPEQAILTGSSSYRLDRILLYLSDTGPEAYFRIGLGRDPNEIEEQWLAVTVLEEILGTVRLPEEPYVGYAQYVRDLFAIAENRKRANENFLSVMQQVGECWGTLIAVRGFTDGESFVLRNAGLRSVWRNGSWQIQYTTMDHDDLTVAGSRYPHLWLWRELSGMTFDAIHILGGILGGQMDDDWIPGEVGALRQIFRVCDAVADAGLETLRQAARAAYDKTQRALETNDSLRALFNENFLRGYRDFDELAASYPTAKPEEMDRWKTDAAETLRRKGHDEELVAETIRAVGHFRIFFEKTAFLYER